MPTKSRAAVSREREEVLETLRAFPSGIRQADLRRAHEARTGNLIAYSTLGRRLAELEKQDRVLASHKGRNPTYVAVVTPPNSSARLPDHESGRDSTIPDERAYWRPPNEKADAVVASDLALSAEGARVLTFVRQPRGQRPPVTYDSRFLDAYRPGQTWYLPEALRERLTQLGTTAYADQPAGTYARDIMQRLVIDLSWGSSHLEGNKYSRIDTEELIDGGRAAHGASDTDRQMILNHKAAIEFLVEYAQDIDFNRRTILNLHALLAENLLDNAEDEGRLRTRAVAIGTSVYTPTAIPQLIEEKFDQMLAKAREIPAAIEQSFFVMVHIPYLQPFRDVNKRTSRLAANISLVRANLCPLSFVDVPEQSYTDGILAVYERTDVALLRDVFAWAYERSCSQFAVLRQAMGKPDPIRLNYRTQLRSVVTDTVIERVWPSDADLSAKAFAYGVPEADRPDFVRAARRDLVSLRAENLGRYRVRQSDFAAWLATIGDVRKILG